jgi:hypothetical protein
MRGVDREFSVAEYFAMEGLWDRLRVSASRPYGTFSSLESLPRTASWAKFSRPCGTHFAIGRFSRRVNGTAEAVPFVLISL